MTSLYEFCEAGMQLNLSRASGKRIAIAKAKLATSIVKLATATKLCGKVLLLDELYYKQYTIYTLSGKRHEAYMLDSQTLTDFFPRGCASQTRLYPPWGCVEENNHVKCVDSQVRPLPN